MKIVIIGKDDVKQFDDALKTPYSFLRFHSPHCGHCVSMQDEMNALMKHEKLQKIDDLSIIDAHTDIASKSNHPVCKKHDGRVPAMYFIVEGKDPMEYEGRRTEDAMAKHIFEQLRGNKIEMSGGKKRKTRKHKKKAKKAHKKKTHKRKPKRKTLKQKKKAKKAHKKKTHKRKHRAHKKK